jgi:hypothetical protein
MPINRNTCPAARADNGTEDAFIAFTGAVRGFGHGKAIGIVFDPYRTAQRLL